MGACFFPLWSGLGPSFNGERDFTWVAWFFYWGKEAKGVEGSSVMHFLVFVIGTSLFKD